MPIVVACECGKRFAARDDLAGRTVACPSCKSPLIIPRPVPPDEGVASILDEIGLREGQRGLICPKCQATIPYGTVACAQCRYNLQTATVASIPTVTVTPHASGYDWSRLRQKAPSQSSVIDEEITLGEILLCGFCGCLGIVYGTALLCTGRSKGIMIIMASVIVSVLLSGLSLLFRSLFTIPAG